MLGYNNNNSKPFFFRMSLFCRKFFSNSQYKTWIVDCGLRTRDCRLGVKHGVGIKCGRWTMFVKTAKLHNMCLPIQLCFPSPWTLGRRDSGTSQRNVCLRRRHYDYLCFMLVCYLFLSVLHFCSCFKYIDKEINKS